MSPALDNVWKMLFASSFNGRYDLFLKPKFHLSKIAIIEVELQGASFKTRVSQLLLGIPILVEMLRCEKRGSVQCPNSKLHSYKL